MKSVILDESRPRGGFRKILLISSLLLLVIMFPMRYLVNEVDHVYGNMILVPFLFLAGLAGLGWIASRPGLTVNQRFLWIVSPIILLIVLGALLRFEGFTGEMLPTFSFRWQSRTVPAKVTRGSFADDLPSSRLADQYDFSEVHFPQFLGPNRDGSVPDVELDPDWSTHPPEILWRQPIGEGWSGFAVEGRRAVTLEQRGDHEVITCYDVLTGQSLWQRPYKAYHTNALGGTGPRATPTIVDGFVYTQGATGIVYCCDLVKGTPQWKQELIEDNPDHTAQKNSEVEVAWGRAGSPLVFNQLVYLPIGGEKGKRGRSLGILDAGVGQVLFRRGDDQISYASPALMTLGGVQQIVMVNENSVSGHALDNGDVYWVYDKWPGQSNGMATASQPIKIADDQILLSKGYAQGMAVIQVEHEGEQWTTKLLWKDSRLLKTKFTTAVVADGFAYGLSDGDLDCVDLQNHKSKWKDRRLKYGHGQILRVGDLLLVTSEDGDIALVEANPEQPREVARLKVLDDINWNTPALAGPFLLIRNSKEAACVRLPLQSGKSLGAKSL